MPLYGGDIDNIASQYYFFTAVAVFRFVVFVRFVK